MNAIIWFDVAAVCLLMIEWYILFLRNRVLILLSQQGF